MSVRTRLWLFVTALLALVLIGNGLVILGIETREIRQSFERESMTFARLAGPQALRAFGELGRTGADPELLDRIKTIMDGLPSAKALALVAPRGRVLVSVPQAQLPPIQHFEEIDPEGRSEYLVHEGERYLQIVMPLRGRTGSPSVLAQVLVSESPVLERIHALRLVYGVSLAILLAVGAAVGFSLARSIVSPVEELRRAAVLIRDGNLKARVPESGGGELAELARAFNAMATQVEEQRSALQGRNAEVERAYAELQALQRELVDLERMAAVGRTASAVSHEIDNPIGIILGTAEMLRRELTGQAELLEDVALIEAECARCRRIVRDLLDFARPSGGGGIVDLPSVVDPLLRGLKHHPEFKGVRVLCQWPPDMPTALADPDGVKQVILNLLLNAAKSMGGKGEISILGSSDDTFVKVSVLDCGPGIPPENMKRIFEPFFTTGAGSGLGLPVSRRIAERSGGRLWAENREGGGSAFHLELPRED